MIPLLTALCTAFTEACKAYVAWVTWTQITHKETTLNALEDEKLRLGDSASPADLLRLEVIAGRIKRTQAQSKRSL